MGILYPTYWHFLELDNVSRPKSGLESLVHDDHYDHLQYQKNLCVCFFCIIHSKTWGKHGKVKMYGATTVKPKR